MITVQLTLQAQTVSDMIAASTAHGLSFNEYIEWRLNADLDAAVTLIRPDVRPDQTAEEIAKQLYDAALGQQAEEYGDEHQEEALPYLVEELYKQHGTGTAWNQLERGTRIMIGKAFKRMVDAQLSGGCQIEDGRQMKVVTQVQPAGHTSQHQARYKTVRVG